jgi:enamine deaminase RidA (YjgF/YER057c/UK114 family)
MNEKFHIINPTTEGSFEERITNLNKLCSEYISSEFNNDRKIVMSRIYLSDPTNQSSPLLVESDLYKTLSPNVSIIGQTPLDGSKISVFIFTSSNASRYVFRSIRLTTDEANCCDAYEQTKILFSRYLETICDTEMTLETNCVRTWIYVRDIDINYSDVVTARNEVFKEHNMTAATHFIASTGIEGDFADPKSLVSIDFLSIKDIVENDKQYLEAIEYLNPTHEYGVAFERGTKVHIGSSDIYFISGTASIDKYGCILHDHDVSLQVDRLLMNIEALLQNSNSSLSKVRYFNVYLRDISDYRYVKGIMEKRFPNIPTLIVYGKVCRPGWLVEMECIAS